VKETEKIEVKEIEKIEVKGTEKIGFEGKPVSNEENQGQTQGQGHMSMDKNLYPSEVESNQTKEFFTPFHKLEESLEYASQKDMDLDKTHDDDDQNFPPQQVVGLTLRHMMVRRAIFGYVNNAYGRLTLTYFMPVWSTHLVKDPPILHASFFGIALGCCALGFAICAPIAMKLIKKLGRRPVIYLGNVVMMIGAGVMAADLG